MFFVLVFTEFIFSSQTIRAVSNAELPILAPANAIVVPPAVAKPAPPPLRKRQSAFRFSLVPKEFVSLSRPIISALFHANLFLQAAPG